MVNNKKVSRRRIGPVKDRNKIAGPWEPLQQYAVPENAQAAKIVALFQNNRYVVYVKTNISTEFKTPEGTPTQGVHLIIARHDKKPVRDWGDLQRIKNEVCGPICEAVELFPSEMRRLDIPNHQTHLWAYEPTVVLPHGLVPKEMHAALHAKKAMQGIPPEMRNVFVVFKQDADGVRCPAEVYASKKEAREIYGSTLDAEPNDVFAGKECGLDTLPPPDFDPPEGAVGSTWTDAAREKHSKFIEIMLTALGGPEDIDAMLEVENEKLGDGLTSEIDDEFSGAAQAARAEEEEAKTEEAAAISLAEERRRWREEVRRDREKRDREG